LAGSRPLAGIFRRRLSWVTSRLVGKTLELTEKGRRRAESIRMQNKAYISAARTLGKLFP